MMYFRNRRHAVGDFFQEFSQVTDEEVIDLLRQGRSESEKTKSMSEVLP